MGSSDQHLREGQLIAAPMFKGPAQVKTFEPKSGHYLLEVVLEETNEFRSLRITDGQLKQIEPYETDRFLSDSSEDLFLYLEANRIRLAYQFDPLLAVNVSQVDPLPHQIEAVYHHALDQPRIRYMIADDPGAGKTIMGGLILKELQYRQNTKRVLIVAPGRLKYQWQREMKERFRTNFTVVDRNTIEAHWSENAWEENPLAVTSIDFIKQDDIKNTLRGVNWDLVIVDEAHKLSARKYDTAEGPKIEKTERYKVGEVLSENADHLLFLTATPHSGDNERFRLFLDLLKPGFFHDVDQIEESVINGENPLFIRRLKEDMEDFAGNPLFPPRHPQTVKFQLSPEELELYNSVTRYVQDYYDQAKEKRHISFALMMLQRRLSSSSYAIYRSLERRREKLEELRDLPEKIQQQREEYERIASIDEDELAEMEEEERWKIEEKLENLTIAQNIEDVRRELEILNELIEKAERVVQMETESKLTKLRDEVLDTLGDKKLLIFTEFKDTVDYLIDRLEDWGYDVTTIHGGMNMDDRIQAEHDFKHEKQIMVATEAAGEGINLQFCSWMVNYDIPWNPNRLEQRMGRIHRYGQDKEVYIWNMVTRNTREGQVLDRIFEKLDRMRKALGDDRVFDIIGEILPGTSLDELMKEAVFEQRRVDEIYDIVDEPDEEYVQTQLDQVFMRSLAKRHIDYSGLLKETLEAEENRLVPEYIEDYFIRAFEKLGGDVEKVDDHYNLSSVPRELKRLNEDYDFKTTYGRVQNRYKHVVFDKDLAQGKSAYEFLAPGHPLLEAVNEVLLRKLNPHPDAYSVFADPDGSEALLWFVEGTVLDGTGEPAGKRVFCVRQQTDGTLHTTHPSILWDLDPLTDADPPDDLLALLDEQDEVEAHLINEVLFPFQEEIREEREQRAQIKQKYGVKSLEHMIQESNEKLLDYQTRQDESGKMDLALRRERARKEDLIERKEQLLEEIKLEQNLTLSEPTILGTAVVIPTDEAGPEAPSDGGMVRDDEIEAVGMEVAMDYETQNGWQPDDVAEENLGFDVRSVRYGDDGSLDDVRYIEVKARARTGAIRLTQNEWKKARRFREDYWLYIVTDAGTDTPKLQRIQNPHESFEVGEDIFASGYTIPRENWQGTVEAP